MTKGLLRIGLISGLIILNICSFVFAYYKNFDLTADKLEFYFGTRTILARGNVVVNLPETLILAQSIQFNIPTQYL